MRQDSLVRLADCLRWPYRRLATAAQQFVSVIAWPESSIRADRDPGLEDQFLQLGGHRSGSSVSETEVEEFACVFGIYRICAFLA